MPVGPGASTFLFATGLDGCLLDATTYSFEAARPALSLLAERSIPLVLASGKTRAEMAASGARHLPGDASHRRERRCSARPREGMRQGAPRLPVAGGVLGSRSGHSAKEYPRGSRRRRRGNRCTRPLLFESRPERGGADLVVGHSQFQQRSSAAPTLRSSASLQSGSVGSVASKADAPLALGAPSFSALW